MRPSKAKPACFYWRTFQIWPIGKLRPMGAGRSLPCRLNSGILRRPEVPGFTTSTWTSGCLRPDAKLAAEPLSGVVSDALQHAGREDLA